MLNNSEMSITISNPVHGDILKLLGLSDQQSQTQSQNILTLNKVVPGFTETIYILSNKLLISLLIDYFMHSVTFRVAKGWLSTGKYYFFTSVSVLCIPD